MRKLSAVPDFMVGSAHAIAEDSSPVTVSAIESQPVPYASTSDEVILVASRKMVADIEIAFIRLREYDLP